MRFHGLIYIACWLSLGTAVGAQEFPDKAVPLSAADLQRVEVQVHADLSKLTPAGRDKWGEIQRSEARMSLVGDCFSDGRRLAVIEVGQAHTSLALAVFDHGQWRLLTTWNVTPAWVPEGKTAEESGYFHISPPANPFQRIDLDGDGVPELLVAFNNDGYRLGYAIIKQDKGEPLPRLLEVFSGCALPQACAGYLLTFTASGRKAWWGETNYYRWDKGLPVHVATWHDDAHDPEKTYWAVTREDSAEVLHVYQVDGEKFEIKQHLRSSDQGEGHEAAYATVEFAWKPGRQPVKRELPPYDLMFETAQLYLFEKLSGLTAAAFGKEVNGMPIAEVLPVLERLNVKVTGSTEAVQRLAPPAGSKRK
jgi:hypothetical protein